MTPLELIGWILVGGVGLIIAALFAALTILIIRSAMHADITPKEKR